MGVDDPVATIRYQPTREKVDNGRRCATRLYIVEIDGRSVGYEEITCTNGEYEVTLSDGRLVPGRFVDDR